MVTTIITAMAAYSNERVAAIILSVLYRMLTLILYIVFSVHNTQKHQSQYYKWCYEIHRLSVRCALNG